jgi:hypothetical protein
MGITMETPRHWKMQMKATKMLLKAMEMLLNMMTTALGSWLHDQVSNFSNKTMCLLHTVSSGTYAHDQFQIGASRTSMERAPME